MSLSTAALQLAYQGWPVFPCRPEGKEPITTRGFKDATTNPQQIGAWWAQNPSANIGHPTGRYVVVEIDGDEGFRTMAHLKAEHEWPVTLTAMSGRGLHLYFEPPEGEPMRNCVGIRPNGRGIGKGIDVRGIGGYVIVPPSVHPSGRRYRWAVRADVAPLPDWMASRLRTPVPFKVTTQDVPEHPRYVSAVRRAELKRVAEAEHGTLNDVLNRAAYSLGRFVGMGALNEDMTFDALLDAAMKNGHPYLGARNTISSGLRAGINRA
jgi:hypothetical protein